MIERGNLETAHGVTPFDRAHIINQRESLIDKRQLVQQGVSPER
jgi:hypothetical protein